MGHNGGFNPYRDANGEFTSPQGAGKPGRARKGSAGGTVTRSRDISSGARGKNRPASPIAKVTWAQSNNPTSLNRLYGETKGVRVTQSDTYIRRKGTDIYGQGGGGGKP